MIRGNIQHWSDIDNCENLLFFSQLIKELLFDYSIPSNRVSTLNSHYLCVDALSAINAIESQGVPEGTLKPIAEELYASLIVDPVFKTLPKSPLHYFIKYQNNNTYRICSNLGELNYDDLKKAICAINDIYFGGFSYFDTCII